MKNIVIFTLVSISSLTVLGYSIHMFIGGLVSPETETTAIGIALVIGVIVLAFIGYDIVKQRRKQGGG